jgi:hypothetical protein
MRVKILQRNVYYKVAAIEIEIPNSINEFDVQEYVNNHEELWADKLEDQMRATDYKNGFGLDTDYNFIDKDQPCEYRYEVDSIGGNL